MSKNFAGFIFCEGERSWSRKESKTIKIRLRNYKIAERVARWLRFVPFVRMVAVTGTLAMKNSEKESDIDFFVVLGERQNFYGEIVGDGDGASSGQEAIRE